MLNELGEKAETLGNASSVMARHWYLYNGDNEKSDGHIRKITAGNQWASFGFIAAEMEMKR